MNGDRVVRLLMADLMLLAISACGETPIDVKALKSLPKKYVGSDTCKMCHLEHYDSWKMTLHSRMMQDAQKNRDVIVTELDPAHIRADLEKIKGKLKIPVDKFYIPKVEDVKYTVGSQLKQCYIVEKDGNLVFAPIQYNLQSHRWVNYNEAKWEKSLWINDCGGCHATGVDLEKKTFVEPGVACEACHGKGSWHAALPKTEVFEKRATIINPAKLTMGVAVQICGSCHNRGKATKHKTAKWAVGYEPGKALEAYFKSTSFGAGDVKRLYANEFSMGHHQQYIDWSLSIHAQEGVTCTSCHYVHQIGVPPTRSQTLSAGSKQCLTCHVQVNKNQAHSIQSFANCIGCHMPKIATSAESGDIHRPDSLVPRPADVVPGTENPLVLRFGAAAGLRFDYWAVFWGLPLLAVTGLPLMYPVAASRIMPGWVLNVLVLLHRAEALLAMLYIFIVHFTIGHLRRGMFPMNECMFAGSVELEKEREEKPLWIARLQEHGRLEEVMVPGPPRWYRIVYFVFGYTSLAVGIYLLVNIILYRNYIEWH